MRRIIIIINLLFISLLVSAQLDTVNTGTGNNSRNGETTLPASEAKANLTNTNPIGLWMY